VQKRPAKAKTKTDRLAAALKENLRRRKAQKQAKSALPAGGTAAEAAGAGRKDAGNPA
jgi:hypothetical protein